MMYVILINFQFKQFDPLKKQFSSLQHQLNKFEWPKGPINLGDLKSMDTSDDDKQNFFFLKLKLCKIMKVANHRTLGTNIIHNKFTSSL